VAGWIGQTGARLEHRGGEPMEDEGGERDGRAAAAAPIRRPRCSGDAGPDPTVDDAVDAVGGVE